MIGKLHQDAVLVGGDDGDDEDDNDDLHHQDRGIDTLDHQS